MKNCFVIMSILLFTFSCSSRRNETSEINSACTDGLCIQTFCPDYDDTENEASQSSVCPFTGTCSLPEMPLRMQRQDGIPSGDIACGPTAVSVALDAAIANSNITTSGWTKSFSQISSSSDPTGDSSNECSQNENCNKVSAAGTKMLQQINSSYEWDSSLDGSDEITTAQIRSFFQSRRTEISSSAIVSNSYDYTNNYNACSFITGTKAITNNQAWSHIVNYQFYEATKGATTKDSNGINVTNISSLDWIGGHYITLNGYEATDHDITFKFHCSEYGFKWYSIRYLEEGEKTCIAWNGNAENNICTQYIVINHIPDLEFDGKIAYLVENQGEEVSSDYIFRIIAFVGGIKP